MGFLWRRGREGSGCSQAGLRKRGAHGTPCGWHLEMEEDIGKASVAQRRRTEGPTTEPGADNAGNGAQEGP